MLSTESLQRNHQLISKIYPASKADNPKARPAVILSMLAIHLGM